jgi:hypothetical protein
MKNKNNLFKIIGSTVIVGAFLFLALGSGDSNSDGDSTNSSTNNVEMHTCTTCGNEYEGGGWQGTSDGVGGDLSLDQGDIFTECKECAQKGMDKANEARSHRGYQGY